MSTASLVLTSYLQSTKYSLESTVNGDNNTIKNEQTSHYNISSVDLSSDADDQCPTWKTLGFELFEIIFLTIMGIGAIFGNSYSEVRD